MIASYPWLALVDIRPAKSDEHWMSQVSGLCEGATEFQVPVVKPANAYNVIRLEDLKIPEGYEPDGESLVKAFRVPDGTGLYLSKDPTEGVRGGATNGPDHRRLCLRKIEPKTRRVIVLESDDPSMVRHWTENAGRSGVWTARFEERAI